MQQFYIFLTEITMHNQLLGKRHQCLTRTFNSRYKDGDMKVNS